MPQEVASDVQVAVAQVDCMLDILIQAVMVKFLLRTVNIYWNEMYTIIVSGTEGAGSFAFHTCCLAIHEIQRKVEKTRKDVVSASYHHLKRFLHMQTKW